ncbi:MAG: rod shape-determining protein [Candidatus ainarchaeum sp.]|jgi:rod shape-determining protein MreB|nr:rod shape-determining protein [Candidatus ainarchaeum sp.]
MFKFLKQIGRLGYDIAIDLGTKNTLVYVDKKGIVINEPSVVAINTKTTEILEIGFEAKKMVGKTPAHIQAIKPLVDGVISDFEITEKMLKHFINKVHGEGFSIFPRPRVIIGIPLDITEVEKKAVEDAAKSAGARKVFLIEEVMASALGAGLPVDSPRANMMVDIGGGTTDIAVISLGGVVSWKSLRIAGNEFDNNIIDYIRDKFNVLIGEQLAEKIKINLASVIPFEEDREMEIRGRDLTNGLPTAIIITDEQVREAIKKTVIKIIENIKLTLEETPPELVADIYEHGLYLSGGGALLYGLDKLIAKATKIPVIVIEDPLTSMVRGAGSLFSDEELLKKITSVLDL